MAENILTGDWLFNDVFIITSYDAVIYSDLLVGALKNIGGCNPEVINGLGSNPNEPVKDRRTPYVLLGTKGLGECGGYESVGDDGPYSPHSQVSILFPLDENEEGIVSSPGRGDSEEDREIPPVFDESFTDWQDKYSPNNYWFRSTEGGGAKSYKIGHVLKTDGPAGASDGGVRIYRKTSAGEWPGALYMPTTDNEHVNPTWIGEQKRTPQHVFLQEGRTYSVEVWGRCETSDGKAYVNVADKRQPDSYDGSYVWSKTSKWDTINPDTGQAVWTKNEFEFTPIKNWHVQDKWKVDFYYDPNDNFGSAPPFDTSGETLPLVKTLYLDSVDYDWNGGYVEVGSNNVRIEVNGTFYAQQSGNYKFRIYHDDGARMWFDGDKIIDFWSKQLDLYLDL